ncbi:MAG TPA: succinate dehydrogenase/fumarate reductase iron-sulfur subunit [Nitrososphaeraceae archaeon]|nr:succinate dehydrogenase/fumarate reductase iron-sulfur subunit [Nitrososphaeraceae archaeon]
MDQIIKKIRMLEKKNNQKDKTKINNTTKADTTRQMIVLNVYRANTHRNDLPRFEKFQIPVQRWMTVLDALLFAKNYLDSSIAIRYSCRMASCGSCGMKINGIPKLACYTKISELQGDTITCEPLSNFPHIRDLVTDFSQFFEHHKEMAPFIHNNDADIRDDNKLSEFKQTPQDVDNYLQFSYCIRCGLCYSACPTVATDTKFPGPQALSQAYRYFADTRDDLSNRRLNAIDGKHGIWRCHFAGSCSKVCPKGVDPALGIQLLRGHIMGYSRNEKKIAKLRDPT